MEMSKQVHLDRAPGFHMFELFCFIVIQLTAAGCQACLSDPQLPEKATQEAVSPEPVDAVLPGSTRQFADRHQPSFPIESKTNPEIGSLHSNSLTSMDLDDSKLPQVDGVMLSIENIASEAGTISKTGLFTYVDYSVLTPGHAFSSDRSSPFLEFHVADAIPIGNRSLLPQFTSLAISAPSSVGLRDEQALRRPKKARGKSLDDIVNRPMSAIQLGAALSPVSSSGESLPTPADTESDRITEIHHLAIPYGFTHPSRNTFPFRHQPLYFEDPNMERCGASNGCLTELTSIAHFATRIPLLPYLMTSIPPHDSVPALRDCPTGCQFGPAAYIPEPTVKAVVVQAAAITGFIFLIP